MPLSSFFFARWFVVFVLLLAMVAQAQGSRDEPVPNTSAGAIQATGAGGAAKEGAALHCTGMGACANVPVDFKLDWDDGVLIKIPIYGVVAVVQERAEAAPRTRSMPWSKAFRFVGEKAKRVSQKVLRRPVQSANEPLHNGAVVPASGGGGGSGSSSGSSAGGSSVSSSSSGSVSAEGVACKEPVD